MKEFAEVALIAIGVGMVCVVILILNVRDRRS